MDFLTIIVAHLQIPEIATGGDKIFFELAKRWSKKAPLKIIVPEFCLPELRKSIEARYCTFGRIPFIEGKLSKKGGPFFLVPLQFLIRIFLVLKLLNKEDKIIYSPGDFITNIVPACLLKIKKRKTIIAVDIHHINENPFKRKGNSFLASCVSFIFQRFSFSLIKKYADVIFLLNSEVKQRLGKMGFNSEKMFIVGSGLDYSVIKNCSKEKKFRFEAAFLGRICPTKGMMDIPKIWARVVEVFPKAKLALVGIYVSPWKEIFEKETDRFKVSNNIRAFGFLPDKKPYEILKSSKIFVSPSYEEGWGMSMCEAKVCGLPLVAYDLPVYKEIFKKGLILVPKGDVSLFAKEIVNLLKNENFRKRVAGEDLSSMKFYDWKNLAEKKIGLIELAVKSFGQ